MIISIHYDWLRNINLIPFRSGGRQPFDQDFLHKVTFINISFTPVSTVSTVIRVSPLSQARLTLVHLLLTRNPSPRRSSSWILTWVFATTTKICTEGSSPQGHPHVWFSTTFTLPPTRQGLVLAGFTFYTFSMDLSMRFSLHRLHLISWRSSIGQSVYAWAPSIFGADSFGR